MTKRTQFKSSFTASVGDLEAGSAAWIEACWNDMRDHADAGEACDAERYISMIPNPSAEQTADLVYGEFVTSRESGKIISAQYYLAKYPEITRQLTRQFTVDEALSEINEDGSVIDNETLVEDLQFISHHGESLGPSKIGRYVILDALKDGSQAEVYRAYDPALKRDVVIKIEAEPNPAKPRMFSDSEAIISANLNHPNLSPVLDAGDHLGRKYSVSRFIRGRTFDQWVRDSKPSPQRVARVLSKVARGLASAHQRGVFHLDITPRNIIIDENQEPYLIDFGLSVVSDVHTEGLIDEGVVRGTLRFMAPELIKGDVEQIGPCSDIFGLGATLFMGWVGRAPYDAPHNRDDLKLIAQGRWHIEWLDEAGLNDEMKSIVGRALAKVPNERYLTCTDFGDALERVAANSESMVGTGDGKRTSRLKICATVAAAIILLAGIATFLRPDSTSVALTTHSASLPSLEISIATNNDHFVELTNRVPLMSSDKIRLQGFIPARQTALVIGFAPDGSNRVLARFEKQDQPRTFQHPSDPGKAIPLVGSGGTEVVALVIGDSDDVLNRVMTQVAQDQKPWALIPETTVLGWHNNQLVQTTPSSGGTDFPRKKLVGNSRSLGDEIEIDSALSKFSQQFRSLAARLNHEGIAVDAIAFRHLNSKQ